MTTPSENKLSGPGVKFPPPLYFVGGLFVGWLLDTRLHALPITTSVSPVIIRGAGYLLVLIGVGVAAWGMITFARARTAIVPVRPASTLVENGPYRFTRNPMYTGMTIAYIGGILILNSFWTLILLPITLILLYKFVVQREERYLAAEFGQAYDNYRKRVKRWL